ncbi:hypothetical protein ES676_11025 [Bizionia saleffrena]|uniref:Tetratricopeptide repeat protein n=1 Tax=Bizionia saleffrena TaxID=291189 RepID=A0A8H2QDX9_9FLAO|nr:hypothetical protein [Bizionia saleffrena]TYB72494.1 hypothetical protein ES676_11025 [Bizionia saleffrena]
MKKEELLNGYFSHSLTPNQEQLFESLLAEDAEFKAQFEFEKNLKLAIKETESERLKTKLKTLETEIKTRKESDEKTQWFNWKIAAAVLLFMSASWFGYDAFFGVNTVELYATNYVTHPNTVFPITRSDTINSIERQAFVAYEAQDFDMALTNFNTIKNPEEYILFYKAQTYLELGDLEKAKGLLNKNTTEASSFIGESHWYLALIYLKQNDIVRAKKELKLVLRQQNYKRQEAKKLLNKLS